MKDNARMFAIAGKLVAAAKSVEKLCDAKQAVYDEMQAQGVSVGYYEEPAVAPSPPSTHADAPDPIADAAEYTQAQYMADLRRQVQSGNAAASKLLGDIRGFTSNSTDVVFEMVSFKENCNECAALRMIDAAQLDLVD